MREELGVEGNDRLKAYAKIFPVVEVNSTFYRIPSLRTVERWRRKADEVRRDFEFTVKAYKGITHVEKFSGKAFEYFEEVKEVAEALRAELILFQTPASFKPTPENLSRARDFFSTINTKRFKIAWEVRWAKDWTEDIVRDMFEDLGIIHAVDPLRQRAYVNPGYYRLHGFGRPIYAYTFSDKELRKALEVVLSQAKGVGTAYVIFNNYSMYQDAVRFMKILESPL